jgi:3-oxoacyl-[acyl-carrier-protein] synthase II
LRNDLVETAALKEVFGPRAYTLPVSSTKALHGHLLGGAGALELLIAVAAMERGVLPPTMHLNAADAGCDLDYVAGAARTGVKLRAVMSNSFALGATNAALIARNAA